MAQPFDTYVDVGSRYEPRFLVGAYCCGWYHYHLPVFGVIRRFPCTCADRRNAVADDSDPGEVVDPRN